MDAIHFTPGALDTENVRRRFLSEKGEAYVYFDSSVAPVLCASLALSISRSSARKRDQQVGLNQHQCGAWIHSPEASGSP